MNRYVFVFALNPSLPNEQVEAVVSKIEKKITSSGGKIIKKTKPTTKKFSTRLRKHPSIKEGLFVEIEFEGPSNLPELLNQIARVTEEIIRYIIAKMPEEKIFDEENREEIVEVNPEMLIGKSE